MAIWKITWMSVFLPLITGLVFFNKLPKSHRFLYIFVFIGFATEVLVQVLKLYADIKNNMPIGHAYISLSFVFIVLFYFHELKEYISTKAIAGVIITFEIFTILNLIFFQSYFEYPSMTGAISALTLVVFSILLFSTIMKEGTIQILSESSVIWINTAVLIYYAGNFFFYILFNHILNYTEFIYSTLNFFKILYVLFYSALAVGFWKAGTLSKAP